MAARTLFILTPNAAEFPTSNPAVPDRSNGRPILKYDATTDWTAYWTVIAPQDITTPLTGVVTYAMATATSGAVGMQITVEAISDGDTVDTDATTSFDSVNNSASTTVPATAGYIDQISITITNADSIAAGDYVRFGLNRDGDGSAITDSATGNQNVYTLEIRDDGA